MSLCSKALLVTKRELFLQAVTNSTASASYRWLASLALLNEPLEFKQHCWLIKRKFRNSTDYINMLDGFLSEYEEVCQIEHEWKLETRNPKIKNIFQHQVCSEAVGAGVDLVSKEFSFNWDYVQSCFFSLTILTTIGLTLHWVLIHKISELFQVMEILPQKHLGAGFSVSCLGWLVRKTWAQQKQNLMKHVSPRDSFDVVSPCWRRWSHGWRFRGRLVSAFFRRGPCLAWKK